MTIETELLPETVSALPLRHLQLLVRTENALFRAGIQTIGTLAATPLEELMLVRNFGSTALLEVKEALSAFRQVVGQDQVDWNHYCQIRNILPLVEDLDKKSLSHRPVFEVAESVKPLTLGHLHLTIRTYKALLRVEVTTVGKLVQAMNEGIYSIQGLGTNSEMCIISAITALNKSTTSEGTIDWFAFWSEQQIPLIPAQHQQGISVSEIIAQLPDLFKEILRQDGDERDWRIIERRFGLNGAKQLKLEELGQTFGLTRERIRQIEARALRELRAVILDNQYSGYTYHIHPDILDAVRSIFELLATQADEYILETQLFDLLETKLQTNFKKSRQAMLMLFELAGLNRIEFNDDNLVPLWVQGNTSDIAVLEQVIVRLDTLFTQEHTMPMEEFDILHHVNKSLPKQKKLSQIQLRRYLDLCSTIERRDDGLYWASFVYLKNRGNQAERILSEQHRTMSAAEIARIVNSRLVPVGKKKVEERNFANHMVADNRFVPVGRSGQWALATWDVETGNITDLMERFLMGRDAPATPQEIFDDVNVRRKVSIASVHLYLQTRTNLFRKMDRTQWGLATWSEAKHAVTWNREQVGEFIASFFREQKVHEVDFRELRDAFTTKTGVTTRQAAGILRSSSAIKTRVDKSTWKRYAEFQPNYRDKLAEKVLRPRKKATQQQRLNEIVFQLLTTQPNRQMALAQVINILQKQHGFLEKTAYLYIARSPALDKCVDEDTGVKMCCLKTDPALAFPQVGQIGDSEVRARVEKAVRRLTAEDVDVGLFELGRDFEVMLKKAIVAGSKNGKVVLSNQLNKPPNEWKLYDMVNCALASNIISQKGIAHYLRQQRNERAHGEGPSLEERQALLNNASRDAALYIDYIILFEARYREWSS